MQAVTLEPSTVDTVRAVVAAGTAGLVAVWPLLVSRMVGMFTRGVQ